MVGIYRYIYIVYYIIYIYLYIYIYSNVVRFDFVITLGRSGKSRKSEMRLEGDACETDSRTFLNRRS